jgi:hypothetical protein
MGWSLKGQAIYVNGGLQHSRTWQCRSADEMRLTHSID